MNVGFDPGCHELRVLFRRGHKLIARHCRSAYAVLPDEPVQRQLLAQSRLPFGTCDGHLVLLGDAISAIGNRLHILARPLFPDGQLATDDPLAQEILAAELETLLPPSPHQDAFCGISWPRESLEQASQTRSTAHEFLGDWVRWRGYTPIDISPARATILAELTRTGFTGLAVTFGAVFCTYSLCYHGEELVSGSLARGGQWVDAQLTEQVQRLGFASQRPAGRNTDGIAAWKITGAPTLVTPRDAEEGLLRDLYCQLLTALFQQLFDDLFHAQLPRPFPAVTLLVSGGVSRIAGFRELLDELWLRPGLPLEITDISFADDSPFTVARGCLIQAGMTSARGKAAA
jgi:hypothetical protein